MRALLCCAVFATLALIPSSRGDELPPLLEWCWSEHGKCDDELAKHCAYVNGRPVTSACTSCSLDPAWYYCGIGLSTCVPGSQPVLNCGNMVIGVCSGSESIGCVPGPDTGDSCYLSPADWIYHECIGD